MTLATAPLDKRGQFIPARKRELFAALAADLGLAADPGSDAARLYELLVALIHHEFLRELELLHDAYHLVDPGEAPSAGPEAAEVAYADVSQSLERVLKAANFLPVDPEVMARAQAMPGRIRIPVRHAADDFRDLKLFWRGEHDETIVRKSLLGLRQHTETLAVYDEVVVIAALHPAHAVPPPKRGRRPRRARKAAARHGSVMIKYFHDIAVADLDALYPGAQVVLSTGDKLSLGLPALVAGVPLALKLIPAALVLYGLIRFYLGARPPDDTSLGEALVVAGGLIALGAFLTNQWTKFQRRALLHQREVNEMIYFHNITNNVGIFDHIIRNAEEQDCKETVLAYLTLLAAPEPLTRRALDRQVERWLKARFGLEVDFEVGDALDKLAAYGLVVRDGELVSVKPLPEALALLDKRWDGLFA